MTPDVSTNLAVLVVEDEPRLRELLEPGGVTASCMPATTNS